METRSSDFYRGSSFNMKANMIYFLYKLSLIINLEEYLHIDKKIEDKYEENNINYFSGNYIFRYCRM